MKQRYLFILIPSVATVFAGSMQDSTSQADKQKVNFCGVLHTAANPSEPIHIENIGMPSYKRIQAYEKPSDPNDPCVDPHKSSAELNLKDISSLKRVPISPEYSQPVKNRDKEGNACGGTYSFKGRKYVEIEVVFNDLQHSKRNYLVEDSRRIVYDEIVDGFVLKRKINIAALHGLEIKGHYEINDDDKETPGARCKMIISGQTPEPETSTTPVKLEKEITIKIETKKAK